MKKVRKHLSLLLVCALMLGANMISTFAVEKGTDPLRTAEEVQPEPTPGDIPPDVLPPGPVTEIDIEALTLSEARLSLGLARTKKLEVIGFVSGGACSLEWISSNPDVASVTSGGSVRAESPGEAKITAQIIREGEVVKKLNCDVTVTMKKVPYATIRSKMYNNRTKVSGTMFEDKGSNEVHLTMFDFYYRSPIYIYPNDRSYGSPWETIILRPMIYAKRDGGTSTVALGVWLQSIVESVGVMNRSYYKMKFVGGGESFDIDGSTHSRRKTIGQYMKYQLMTNGTFRISVNTGTHLSRLDKLKRILSSKKARIVVKDKAANRTYKCKIDRDHCDMLKKFIKVYKKCLKTY
ncbi:MAG: Ig-like domain-containing protein [Eubacterium sp.]|nr:Ig-like domain-containing protein [Eubacterium sp.]